MESSNAAEWDLHRTRNHPPRRGDDDDGWQTVTKPDKGKAKVTQQVPASTASKPTQKSKQGKQPGKWQDSRGRAPQTRQQHPTTPKLIDADEGNEAQAQWRALQPAKLFVRVPTELAFAEDGGILQHLEQIARQHLCHVARDSRANSSSDSQAFGIWGAGKQTEDTRSAINKWVEEMMGPQKSTRAGRFAKLHSMTPKLREREEKRWLREVQKQRFRQHPPLNMAFGAIGTFHWPVKDYAPREILGPNYEALDQIRMACSCYVVWQKNSFQVMGKTMEKVKAALQRLRQTVFQIAAKQLPTSRMYLLYWPDDLRCDSVQLEEYEQPRQLSGPATTSEIRQHPTVRGQGFKSEQNRSTASERRIYSTIMWTLSKLPNYRGSIKLRLHFGRFLATQYMLPENGAYSLEDYESMIKESQFQGLITDELGHREMEQAALSTMQDADDLLIPLDHAVSTLSEVQPIYTVVFAFAHPQGDLHLTSSWSLAEDGISADRISQKWTRLDRETGTAASLVQICLMNLSTSFGWAFTLDAAQLVDENRIEPALANFAYALRADVPAMQRQATDRPFLRSNAYMPKVALRSIEQRVTYSYGMRDLDYSVELSRVQKMLYPRRETRSVIPPAASQTRIFEPRWGVSVYRVEWDTMFAENERLAVGDKASWEADTERWFPKGWNDPEEAEKGRYFLSLMAKLQSLDKLLRDGARNEDLLGGMTIG